MKVTGSIQERYGIYQMMIRCKNGRESIQKSKSTRIKVGANNREQHANRRKAERMLAEWIEEVEKTDGFVSYRLFMDCLDEWLERKRKDIRANSIEAYESYIKNHIRPYWEPKGMYVNEISVQDVQRFIDYEYKSGQSSRSIQKHLVVINGVFDEAIRFGELQYNPCRNVKLPRAEPFKGQAYSLDQVNSLLDGIKGHAVEPAIMLAIYLGLRQSEIAGLRWQDVDFDENIVRIRNTVVRFSNSYEREQTKSKASRRDLYLPMALREYLLKLQEQQRLNNTLCGKDFVDSNHICQWPDGSPQEPGWIYKNYKRIQKALGLPSIRLHDLRHTAGSLLINNGQTIKQVQSFLGHEKAATTLDIYAHVDLEGKKDTAAAMDSLLARKSC